MVTGEPEGLPWGRAALADRWTDLAGASLLEPSLVWTGAALLRWGGFDGTNLSAKGERLAGPRLESSSRPPRRGQMGLAA